MPKFNIQRERSDDTKRQNRARANTVFKGAFGIPLTAGNEDRFEDVDAVFKHLLTYSKSSTAEAMTNGVCLYLAEANHGALAQRYQKMKKTLRAAINLKGKGIDEYDVFTVIPNDESAPTRALLAAASSAAIELQWWE